MAGQLPSLSRFGQKAQSAMQNAPAQMAQAIKQTAVNEIKATTQDAVEQMGADEFIPQEPEPLRQGQLADPESHSAQVKQAESARMSQLRSLLEQEIAKARGDRQQTEQAYNQNVNEQMQAMTQTQQAPVESVMPTPNRPSAKKSAELQKKKN